MSITILSLGPENRKATTAHIRHGNHEFKALVFGTASSLATLINQSTLVEMSFERIASWQSLPTYRDEQACIRSAEEEGAAVIVGRVHNITELDENSKVIDLYLQAGPEFFAIHSDELGNSIPEVGNALELTVHGLCFYPTNI